MKSIRKPYQIATKPLKVNASSMVNYGGNQYYVPMDYIGKSLIVQTYDGYIHAYYNTTLVTVHQISNNKLNPRVKSLFPLSLY